MATSRVNLTSVPKDIEDELTLTKNSSLVMQNESPSKSVFVADSVDQPSVGDPAAEYKRKEFFVIKAISGSKVWAWVEKGQGNIIKLEAP